MNPQDTRREQALQAIAERAKRLFQDGYFIERRDDDLDLVVVANASEGVKHYVSPFFGSCTCPGYFRYGSCLALEGWRKLESDQSEYDEHLLSGYDEEAEYGKAVMDESLYRRLANGAEV